MVVVACTAAQVSGAELIVHLTTQATAQPSAVLPQLTTNARCFEQQLIASSNKVYTVLASQDASQM